MTLHYHGTPITPATEMVKMAGRHFCVSHWAPDQVKTCHRNGQSVMLDNGAFSAWKSGKPITDWQPYLAWTDEWLDYPTTWAVIPDVVAGDDAQQEELIAQWPHGHRGAPVWHLHESIARLLRLLDDWPRVCMGSSAEFKDVLSPPWERRMDEAWQEIVGRHRRTPNVHMLRGMQLVRHRWPFASVDSTDIARNHNRAHNCPAKMATRWDAAQCQAHYVPPPVQFDLVEQAA